MSRLRDFIPLLLVLLAITIAAAVYGPVRRYDFVEFDDPELVSRNVYVQRPPDAQAVGWAMTTIQHGYWMPLTWLSLMGDWAIHQPYDAQAGTLDAGGYHLTNLLLHLLNVLLLFVALRALTGAAMPSAVVAVLFALHPVHVESVAWVTERKDVLAMCFGLAALWAYARYVHRGGVWRYALVALMLALSLMAKPMLVTLPCVLLLVDIWPLRRLRPPLLPGPPEKGRGEKASKRPSDRATQRPSKPLAASRDRSTARAVGDVSAAVRSRDATITRPLMLLLDKLPLFALVGAVSAMTFVLQRGAGRMASSEVPLTLIARTSNAAVSYVRYIAHAVWPTDVAVLYPHAYIVGDGYAAWQVIGAAIIVVTLTAVSIAILLRGNRKSAFAAVGWLWFVGTMLPMVGLVQVGSQAMADRFAYFPALGLYIIFAWALVSIAHRIAAGYRAIALVVVVMVCLITALAWRTHMQVQTWQNSETLFTHALNVTKRNDRIHYRYASWLAQQERYEQAASHYQASLAIQSDPAAHNGYGDVLFRMDRIAEAEEQFQAALATSLTAASRYQSHSNLAQVRMAQQRFGDAVAQYEAAIDAIADDTAMVRIRSDLHHNAGIAAARGGRLSLARKHFEQGLQLTPNDAELTRLLRKAIADGG